VVEIDDILVQALTRRARLKMQRLMCSAEEQFLHLQQRQQLQQNQHQHARTLLAAAVESGGANNNSSSNSTSNGGGGSNSSSNSPSKQQQQQQLPSLTVIDIAQEMLAEEFRLAFQNCKTSNAPGASAQRLSQRQLFS
jgi:hypothetical protein